jgi:hypothetical protein
MTDDANPEWGIEAVELSVGGVKLGTPGLEPREDFITIPTAPTEAERFNAQVQTLATDIKTEALVMLKTLYNANWELSPEAEVLLDVIAHRLVLQKNETELLMRHYESLAAQVARWRR